MLANGCKNLLYGELWVFGAARIIIGMQKVTFVWDS